VIWSPVIGVLAGLVLFGIGSAVAEYRRDRAEARRAVREWDATVRDTTGLAWNPHTRRYEKPPHTVPYTPPRPRWWEYPAGDLILVILCLYASWRLRKDKRGGNRG
jgi:hypothetical protein